MPGSRISGSGASTVEGACPVEAGDRQRNRSPPPVTRPELVFTRLAWSGVILRLEISWKIGYATEPAVAGTGLANFPYNFPGSLRRSSGNGNNVPGIRRFHSWRARLFEAPNRY